MMKTLLLIYASTLLLSAAPRLHPVPEHIRPYVHRLRHETVFVAWWMGHRDSTDPLRDFVLDGSQPVQDRQRAWQARRKL